MLSGGIFTSMAVSNTAFQQFVSYNAKARNAVFKTTEDLALTPNTEVTMHAVFCYGWWDNPSDVEDGWWLCKNRCAWLRPVTYRTIGR